MSGLMLGDWFETPWDFTETDGPYVVCECTDRECISCHGRCDDAAIAEYARVDTTDSSGVMFCEGCADDACDTGLYEMIGGVE